MSTFFLWQKDKYYQILREQGAVTITGAPSGTPINAYDLSGRLVVSTQAAEGTTRVEADTNEKVVIVKVGERSVKVSR